MVPAGLIASVNLDDTRPIEPEAFFLRRGNLRVDKAIKLKAALAAPFLFFAIDNLISKTWSAIHERDTAALLSQTHPPGEMRLEKFRKRTGFIPLKYLGYTTYAWSLWEMTEAITKRVKAIL